LYGGIFGVLASMAFYIFGVYIAARLLRRSAAQATIGVLVLASFGYLLVSSNTVFSIWPSAVLLTIAALFDGMPTGRDASRTHST
jgi:hypothetical protein